MMVSCLSVTNRPHFREWLEWNYNKQTLPEDERELIVIDGPGSVAEKRNEALQKARGDYICWFDDDDWQHPNRLEWSAQQAAGSVMIGSGMSWMLNLKSLRACWFQLPIAIFNSICAPREVATQLVFRDLERGSDSPWIQELYPKLTPVIVPHILFGWLCHTSNLSNPAGRWPDSTPLVDLVSKVGSEAWGDTDLHLRNVQKKVYVKHEIAS